MNPRLPFTRRLQPLAARLSKACQLARRSGFEIVDGTFGSPEKGCMCPVRALHWSEGTEIGVDMFDGEDEFVSGFDGIHREIATDVYDLGLEFRKQFIGKGLL